MPPESRKSRIQDLVRLGPKAAARLLARLDGEATDRTGPDDRRTCCRYRYQDVPRLVVGKRDPDRRRDEFFAMIPRNIGARGLSLLHGRMVFPGTKCAVNLKTLQGNLVSVRGTAVHCRSVEGRVHEFGLRFDHPLQIADYVSGAVDESAESQDEAA